MKGSRWLQGAPLVVFLLLMATFDTAGQPSQAANMPRIGYLFLQPWSASAHLREAFRQGLRDLGYVQGQNIVIDFRNAEGKPERLPDLAAELLRLKVDVLVAAPEASIRPSRRRGRSRW
jgi:putative ABC transport system substrate-binding protein